MSIQQMPVILDKEMLIDQCHPNQNKSTAPRFKENDLENDEEEMDFNMVLNQAKSRQELLNAIKRIKRMPKVTKKITVVRESIELQLSLMEKAGTILSKKKLVRSRSVFVPKSTKKLQVAKKIQGKKRRQRVRDDTDLHKRAKMSFVGLNRYARKQRHFEGQSRIVLGDTRANIKEKIKLIDKKTSGQE